MFLFKSCVIISLLLKCRVARHQRRCEVKIDQELCDLTMAAMAAAAVLVLLFALPRAEGRNAQASPLGATGVVGECVAQGVLTCINDKASYWPKCDPAQNKNVAGPAGYDFGSYCTQEWADSLNNMLSDPAVAKCSDRSAVHKMLAQVAYETGYFSTVFQPKDGGAGLIHMIPGNWPVNAADMDVLFPGQGRPYKQIAAAMGKDFFQTATYGWKSVAAWFKRTNSVVPGCGINLFDQSFDEQTRCILGRVVSRQEAFDIVGSCLPEAGASPTLTRTPTSGCDSCMAPKNCLHPTWADPCSIAGSQAHCTSSSQGATWCG